MDAKELKASLQKVAENLETVAAELEAQASEEAQTTKTASVGSSEFGMGDVSTFNQNRNQMLEFCLS